MIIIHFYIVNYTTPIFAGIILEKAENCKEFLPLIFGEIGSFNCIVLMFHQSLENVCNPRPRNTEISRQISTSFNATGAKQGLPLHCSLDSVCFDLCTCFTLHFLLGSGIQGKYQRLSPTICVKSEIQRCCEVYAFSSQSVNRPILRNAYALSVWTGEVAAKPQQSSRKANRGA